MRILAEKLRALHFHIYQSHAPPGAFYYDRRGVIMYTPPGKRKPITGISVLAQYDRMEHPNNLSVNKRMAQAARALEDHKADAVRQNAARQAERRNALHHIAARVASSSLASPLPVLNRTSTALQRYLGSIFNEIGRSKASITVTGLAGDLSSKSLFQQLKDWSSDNAPDGCRFHPIPLPVSGNKKLDVCPIMPHQAVVHAIAHLRATNAISTPGLLAFHSTGSGKTLESLAVMIQFWHTPYAIFSCSTRSNQSGNDLLALAKLARRHFPYAHPGFSDTLQLAYETLAERLVAGYKSIIDGEANFKKWLARAGLNADPAKRLEKYRAVVTAMQTHGDPKVIAAGRTYESRLLATYTTLINDVAKYNFRGIERVSIGDRRVTGVLRNAVFILDEVQFLVGATASTEQGYVNEYRTMKNLLTNHRDPKTTWVFAATATPGTNFAQFKDVLNIVQGKSLFSGLSVRELHTNAAARSLISYVNMAGNRAQFAAHHLVVECVDIWSSPRFARRYYKYVLELDHIPDAVRKKIRDHFAKHDANRFERDLGGYTVSRRVKNKGTGNVVLKHNKRIAVRKIKRNRLEYDGADPNSRPEKFYKHLRRAAMFLATGSTKGLEPRDVRNVHEPFSQTVVSVGKITANGRIGIFTRSMVVGPKIVKLLQRIREYPTSVHYVYVTDPDSVKLIAYLLVRDLKMSLYTRNTTPSRAGTFGFVNERKSTDTRDKFRAFTTWTADDVRRVITDASSKQNITGKVVRVLLATNDAFKGVDVGNIRHLHLLDPMVDFQQFVQFIGRGPRFCSHKHAPMTSRKVVTHVYRIQSSKWPTDPIVFADHVVWERAWGQYQKEWGAVIKVIEDIAVDAPLFKPTFNAAANTFLRGLHQEACELATATFNRVRGAKRVRSNGNGNSDNNNNNNNNGPILNMNDDAANRAILNNLQSLRRVNINVNASGRSTRKSEAVRALKANTSANAQRFVELQRKMTRNGINNAERLELLSLQRAIQKGPHAGIF